MSWEIFASAFNNGQAAEFDTSALRSVFERGALPHPKWPPQRTDYLYGDGHIRLDIECYEPRRDSFVVYRIFGHTACARLLEAAALFNCLIYWPGEECFTAVPNEAVLEHLPQDAVATNPRITKDVDAFVDAVGFTSRMTMEDWIIAEKKYTAWYEKNDPENSSNP